MSLPSRECGLKFLYESPAGYPALVTPFTGVWIEIYQWANLRWQPPGSLPSRECGLKSPLFRRCVHPDRSLPSRECGLKYMELSIMV